MALYGVLAGVRVFSWVATRDRRSMSYKHIIVGGCYSFGIGLRRYGRMFFDKFK
jgi:hypothetical protein